MSERQEKFVLFLLVISLTVLIYWVLHISGNF